MSETETETKTDSPLQIDEQEARSRKYTDDVIILLPLASGNIAVFNNARQLTGIAIANNGEISKSIAWIKAKLWKPPAKQIPREEPKPDPTFELDTTPTPTKSIDIMKFV